MGPRPLGQRAWSRTEPNPISLFAQDPFRIESGLAGFNGGGAHNPEHRRYIGCRRITMLEAAISLMAIADMRQTGYVEVPPSGLTPEIYEELILSGHAVGRSDYLWMDGWRVYSPRAIRAGLYQAYVPHSIYTRIASSDARIPEIHELEAVPQAELPANDLDPARDKSRMN